MNRLSEDTKNGSCTLFLKTMKIMRTKLIFKLNSTKKAAYKPNGRLGSVRPDTILGRIFSPEIIDL